MSRLKDKVIKWFGGFTETEVEEIKAKDLLQEPCIVRERLETVKLCSSMRVNVSDELPIEHIRELLAERLLNQIEDNMHVEKLLGSNPFETYMAEIEVVVREGDR